MSDFPTTDAYLEDFMKISLIIPCYNEEEALPYIYEELVKVSATLSDYEIEYLFVNDGSKDHTLDKLK